MVAATTSADGSTVTLTFDMNIDGATISASNFAILVNSKAEVIAGAIIASSDSKKIELTLSQAIPNSKASVTVAYTSGTLKALSGSDVAAFGPVTVTNNVKTGINKYGISMRIYPNPVVDVINIQSSTVFNTIDLFDLTGRKIKEIPNISNNTISIPVSDISKGVYILSVKSNSGVFSQRITIE
jgi:hypothetical protein